MKHINNIDRFNQNVDFKTFPAAATDIDGLIHAKGQCWLWLEAKVEGHGLPQGQEIMAKDLVRSLGKTAPAFFTVAHHDTRASEDITGDNLLVSKVYASAPWTKGKVFEHIYAERPTWTNFASDVLLVTGGNRIIHFDKANFCNGGEPGDIKDMLNGYLWKAMGHQNLMQEYADLDFVDREDMSEELWAFIQSFGFDEDDDKALLIFEGFVFNCWLANRHLIA